MLEMGRMGTGKVTDDRDDQNPKMQQNQDRHLDL
jgi:hypothetical protein